MKPGDNLRVFSPKGDPTDPSTDLSQAYIVPDPFILQPFYFSGYIRTEQLSEIEITRLETALASKLTEKLISEVNRAIDEFVCTVALQHRLATWKQIESHLQLILKTCGTLITSAHALVKLTNPAEIDNSVSQGTLSADQLIKKMLMDHVDPEKYILKVYLDTIIAPCIQAHEDIKAKIKRGRKPENIFRLFISRLATAMREEGYEVKVPSNENSTDKAHPSFVFINTVLSVCIEKGKLSVTASDLTEAEKNDAIKVLSHHKKSARAIGHYLREGFPNKATMTLD